MAPLFGPVGFNEFFTCLFRNPQDGPASSSGTLRPALLRRFRWHGLILRSAVTQYRSPGTSAPPCPKLQGRVPSQRHRACLAVPQSAAPPEVMLICRYQQQYGRYGYRRVRALLQSQGWEVSHGRVMRIWRREGLKVPHKQPKRCGFCAFPRFQR